MSQLSFNFGDCNTGSSQICAQAGLQSGCWTQGAAVSAFTPGGAAPAKSGASAAALSSLAALVLAVAAAAAAAF